jgi:hypothetical protein
MQCIFCLQEREPGVEHVFPDAIGGKLTINRVCKTCNNELSKVDRLLNEHIAVLLKRNQLGIKSRHGRTPDWHDIFGLASMADDPDQRVRLVQDKETGQIKPMLLYKESRVKTEDGGEQISIVLDAAHSYEIGKIILRARQRVGLPALSDVELKQQIQETVRMGTIEQPAVLHTLAVDVWHYQRAICKIVYELAWLWLGDSYLDDPTAIKLRNVILQGTEENVRGQIRIGCNTPPFDKLWVDEPMSHIGLCMAAGPMISIGVRVFDVMCGMVTVTEIPDRYPDFVSGEFCCCDPQTGTSRDSSLPRELHRLIQSRVSL